jgi:hypothetical protein
MEKKLYSVLLVLLVISLIYVDVDAREEVFTNNNGVSFSEDEYSFLQQFYWDSYPNEMTLEEYDEFINSGMLDFGVETVYLEESAQVYSTSISTTNKSLKISKSCSSSYCKISTTLTWINYPKINSYDVIGARLSETSLLDEPKTTIVSSNQTSYSTDTLKFTNGFGTSIKVPSNCTSLTINQTYKVSIGGTVYASYQHATKNVTLKESQNYTISSSGYGSVFAFNNSAYDGMRGVKMDV